MKNKIAIASAFFAASSLSFAEIALTENLSVEGFVDMSYSHVDNDTVASESDNSYKLDQVEITFLLDFGAVSAQVDTEYTTAAGSGELDQAFVNYDLGNGITLTAGNYDSMLGFEAFEATGLYQASKAYESKGEIFTDQNITYSDLITPGTNNGVKLTYGSGSDIFAISLQDGAFFADGRLGGDESGDALTDALAQILGVPPVGFSGHAVEVAYAKDLGNGFNAFLGAVFEETVIDTAGVEIDIDSSVVNAYLTYETGAWLFAAEYTVTEHDVQNDGSAEVDSFLLMANYSYSEQASITGRFSNVDVKDYLDATKVTAAHNYAFTDNLALCVELSAVDYDYEGAQSGDILEGVVELLFTF